MHINGKATLWENVVRKQRTSHLSTAMSADGRINVIMKICLLSQKLHQQYAINLRGFCKYCDNVTVTHLIYLEKSFPNYHADKNTIPSHVLI